MNKKYADSIWSNNSGVNTPIPFLEPMALASQIDIMLALKKALKDE